MTSFLAFLGIALFIFLLFLYRWHIGTEKHDENINRNEEADNELRPLVFSHQEECNSSISKSMTTAISNLGMIPDDVKNAGEASAYIEKVTHIFMNR